MLHGLLKSAALLTPSEIGEERAERRLEAFGLVAGRQRQAKPQGAEIGLPRFIG
jgi:hypothetical protein